LEKLRIDHPDRVGDIRALGAMVALELVQEGDADKPDAVLAKSLCAKAVESGLILLSCGVRGNVIRILAPLTIDFEHLDEGLDILQRSFKACL
jgi:4-aminobutyrate aminotransferase-like enzyme